MAFDLDDAISSAKAQPPLSPFDMDSALGIKKPGFLANVAGLAARGGERLVAGLPLVGDAATGQVDEAAAGQIAKGLRIPDNKPKELQQVVDTFTPYTQKWKDAQGFGESAGVIGSMAVDIGKEAATNPKGLIYATAEQAANMVPSMAGMYAGGKAGAALGTAVAPGIGTTIGAGLGALGGAFLGGWSTEAGAELTGRVGQELAKRGLAPTEANIQTLLQEEQTKTDLIEAARNKATGTALTDAALTVIGGKVASAPRRAAQKAAIADLGVDATKEAIEAATEAGLKNTSLATRAGYGVAGGAIDTAGEGLSEAAGQKLATGEVDMADVAMETFAGVGGAAPSIITAGKAMATRPGVEATPEQEEVQRQALAKATGGDVEIVDGVATITDGENTITAPVEELSKHFVSGGTLDTLAPVEPAASTIERAELRRQQDGLQFETEETVALPAEEPAAPTPAAITRLTELEQKAQGLPGVTTPTSLSPQEEQEYTALRAQVSPADAQRLQEYQANVARRDELALKQAGAPAFETVGEGGVATVVPERVGQTLTPKEQVELARLVEVTRQPPVSPYIDDSRTLAAGLPAAQSETLFSQRPPWETGPIQEPEAVASVAQQVNPNVRYDGAMLDLHNFTIALPDGRQPSFTVKGEVTPQTFTEALNATEARFGVPLTQAADTLFSQPVNIEPTPEDFAKTQVTLKGYLPNGKVGEYKVNADKALAEIDADISLYEQLMRCVKS